MRGKRIDNKTRANLITKRINEDEKTVSELAKEVWIKERTAHHILNTEFAEVCEKSDKVAKIIDTNNEIIALADKRIKQMLQNEEETIKISELVQVRDSGFKQNQLVTGKSTENLWIVSISTIIQEIQWIKK